MNTGKSEGAKEKRPLTEVFERAWSQALLAVSAAEEEAAKALQKAGEVAGWSQDEMKRHVREFTERLIGQRREMERSVEDGVKRALARLKVPRREELQDVQARMERLTARLDAQLASRARASVQDRSDRS